MMDIAAWGGAQWVLLTMLFMGLFIPWGYSENSGKEFAIEWVAKLLVRAGLVGILAWGGFWS